MTIRMDELIKAISVALDAVESELVGVSTNHGRRIATLCAAMGRSLGYDTARLSALTACALLHDNALTEYILSEMDPGQIDNALLHCIYGQRNAETLPFRTGIDGFILYHHENADGSGLFNKVEGEYPREAGLIAIADAVDVKFHLESLSQNDLGMVREFINSPIFSKEASSAMLRVLDADMLRSLRNENIMETAGRAIPKWSVDAEDIAVMRISELIARIIDYKSTFTKKHTLQIANRSWLLSGYYGYDYAMRSQIYLAAALHDIGKLMIPTDILEKPGKLTVEEYEIIKKHVVYTYEILDFDGFEHIRDWAAFHHEKLDGTGYPFGKKAHELDFIARMMACIDIYQAVSEERPYHPRRGHEGTMRILREMAGRGFIDAEIASDCGNYFAEFSYTDVPPPLYAQEEYILPVRTKITSGREVM